MTMPTTTPPTMPLRAFGPFGLVSHTLVSTLHRLPLHEFQSVWLPVPWEAAAGGGGEVASMESKGIAMYHGIPGRSRVVFAYSVSP